MIRIFLVCRVKCPIAHEQPKKIKQQHKEKNVAFDALVCTFAVLLIDPPWRPHVGAPVTSRLLRGDMKESSVGGERHLAPSLRVNVRFGLNEEKISIQAKRPLAGESKITHISCSCIKPVRNILSGELQNRLNQQTWNRINAVNSTCIALVRRVVPLFSATNFVRSYTLPKKETQQSVETSCRATSAGE